MQPLPANIGRLQALINPYALSLRASGKADKTLRTYRDAVTKFAGWLLDSGASAEEVVKVVRDDWADVEKTDIEHYMIWLMERYSDGYANNQYRALQQFFKWHSDEEELPNPMAKLSPPKPGERVVPVLEVDQLGMLIKDCDGKSFDARRDVAIIRFFASTGARLAEVANLDINDVDLTTRTARVIGKGDRERIVKFDHKCAQAIDRYLRVRARHKLADSPKLWLGVRNREPMTPDGVYQMIARRGGRLGIPVHPHMFRHTFSHRWLDAGGAEGDLMEINGWTSPQMIRHYGRSARGARARRAYDRVDVMGGV
ncbi:tyrosine-type recombinase/integrase [Virgisporangium aliadipatigenens]|uniref:tyrosine-type recombinase/integrase n=1 Tax=Virgisporangium aliadipatigenens TaxID=741659 RepID=UPI001EF259E4|nr:tyrosine-type recombinase/integrase [Virgisporangium aliadipatigenens]